MRPVRKKLVLATFFFILREEMASAAAAGVVGAPLISPAFRSLAPPHPPLYHYTSLNFAVFNGHHHHNGHCITQSTAARASRRSDQPPQESEAGPIDDLLVSEVRMQELTFKLLGEYHNLCWVGQSPYSTFLVRTSSGWGMSALSGC